MSSVSKITRAAAPERTSFGLLIYEGTDNIGDEIQSLAARRFLNDIDYLIDREQINLFRPDSARESVKVILNGWFCHFPESFFPGSGLQVLPVSMHITPAARARFSDPKIVAFLAKHGPVGARDVDTLEFFQSLGLDAYFSGCLTMTLPKPRAEASENVVLNDVPPEIIGAVASATTRNILFTRHSGHVEHSPHVRLSKAEALLKTYASAHAVITTRLHCAMPCVAMETPVLLLTTAQDQERFAGLHEFVNHCSVEDFMSGRYDWSPERPPSNPNRHSILRHNLIRRAMRFVDPESSMPRPDSASLHDAA